MFKRTLITGACLAALLAPAAAGQSRAPAQGVPQTQPWGVEPGESAAPYRPAARDANGNAIIINGRRVDGAAGAGSISPMARAGGTLSARGTLPRPGVNAVSIGNSVSITNAYASTIIINQTNQGDQTVNVGAGDVSNDPDGEN
jgi:hypothetical protein